MSHDVFISHSAHNREVADDICAALEKTGIRCWVAPRDVRPGRSFPGEITRAIQQSKVMVMVFSSHSNNSEQVLREVQLATDSHLVIIRFRIEDVALTDDLRYFLSSPHWLDALTPPLSKHIERLQIAIKELLDQSVEVTGKDVAVDDVKVATPPVLTPVAAPPEVTPAAPPPTPIAIAPIMPPPLPSPAPVQKKPEPVKPKSFNPWPLLAIAAAVICAAIIGVIFFLVRQPTPSKQQQASTAPAQSAPTPVATTKRPSPPATKVTQNPAPPKAPKTTPAPDVQSSTESESASAFDRAGSLKRPTAPKSAGKKEQKDEQKSAFDRAGGTIGSDQPEKEPSPDE
jgi:TIR domain